MKIVYGTLRRSAGALSCKCYANEPRCSPNAHLISSWSTCAFASLLPRFGRLIPYVNEAGVFFEEASSGPRPAWRLICPQEGVDAPSMETAVGGSRIINKRLTRFVFQFSNCISLSACAEISLCAPSDGSWNISIVPRRRLIIYLLRFCVCFALFIVLAFWNCVSWFISEETQRDLILKWKKKTNQYFTTIFFPTALEDFSPSFFGFLLLLLLLLLLLSCFKWYKVDSSAWQRRSRPNLFK